MLKKLLKKIFYVSSYNNEKNHIEQYLAQSKNLYDLEDVIFVADGVEYNVKPEEYILTKI